MEVDPKGHMRRIIAAALALALNLTSVGPAEAAITDAIDTGLVSAFSSGSSTLSLSQKSQIKKKLASLPVATKVICTGYRLSTESSSVLTLAKKRANAVCTYIKRLDRNIEISSKTFTTKLPSNRGKVHLKFTTPALPAEPVTLDNLDINWVGRSAVSKTLEYASTAPAISISRKVIQSPNVPPDFATSRIALLDKAVKAFAREFRQNYKVVFFTEKDGEWADAKLAELGGQFPGKISDYIAKLPSAKDCSFAFSTWDKDGLPIYYACLNSLSYKGLAADHTPIHEYFHLVQNPLFKTRDQFMPLWLNEGPPVFFGFALAYGAKDRANQAAEKFYGYAPLFDPEATGTVDSKRIATFLKTATEAQIVSVYQTLELDPTNRNAYNHYGLGGLATQVLVAVFGVEAYFDFLRKTAELPWKEAFAQQYGLTTTDFYKKLVPYIHAIGNKYF